MTLNSARSHPLFGKWLAVGIFSLAGSLIALGESAPLLVRTAFDTPTPLNHFGLTVGPDGNLWYEAQNILDSTPLFQTFFGRVSPSGDTVEISSRGPVILEPGMASAAGRVWYSGAVVAQRKQAIFFIGSILPGQQPVLGPGLPERAEAMTTGTDGNVWFLSVDSVGRLVPPSSVTHYSCGTLSDPRNCGGSIAPGAANDIWFTYKESARIGRITSDGNLTVYDLTGWVSPFGIALGPDGAMWFTDVNKSYIGRITSAGRVDEYPIPSGASAGEMIRAADGSLWFQTSYGIGRLITHGASPPEIQEFPTSDTVWALAPAPDGTIWLAEGLRIVHVETIRCPDGNLCLQGRFRVRLTWRSPGGAAAPGNSVSRNTNYGYFWFFSPENVEVAIKIVDGRKVNGHFWVFGASLTDVGYALEITDTLTGAVWSHHNSAGELASFVETDAF